MSQYVSVAYACDGCGATYTASVYGGLAHEELGEGRRGPNLEPTHAAACAKCGGRFRLIKEFQ
jgi:DNA-directed RNA polymerase subunit RPC12/RpoP